MKKINEVFIIIMLLEIFLGGLGRLFDLPIRISLFAIALFLASYDAYKNKKIYLAKSTIKAFVIIFAILAIFFIISVVKGNEISKVFSELNVYIGLLYVFIVSQYIKGDRSKLIKIIDIIRVSGIILAICTILVVVWSFIFNKFGGNSVRLLMKFQKASNYGLITGSLFGNKIARVYFVNGIYMQIAFALELSKCYLSEMKLKKNNYICLAILVLGILVSNTRGFWLGATVIFICIFILSKRKIEILKLTSLLGVLVALILLKLNVLNSTINRIFSISDFSGDISNNIRKIQLQYLLSEIKQKPILGWGFGAKLQGYSEKTSRDAYNVELFYFQQMFKGGIVFLSIYIGSIVILIKKCISLLDNKLINKSILLGYVIGVISLMISSFTNPYLSGTFGFFIIDILIVIVNFIVLNNRDVC